jgi:hypothetical protein
MRNLFASLAAVVLLAGAPALHANDDPPGRKSSPEFERMKTLVGTWTGRTDMGQGPVEMTTHFRLIAAGSVVEERVFAGTPQEMVTMYYDQGGKLALTHYCMIGNRPTMLLKSSDAKTIEFDFDPTCGINPRKESHMHALKITFNDAGTITTSYRAFLDGQEAPAHPVTLKRVK